MRLVQTDVDGLDADALLDVGLLRVVRRLVLQHGALAERVDERCPARARRACWPVRRYAPWKRKAREKDPPTTMTVNWTPFLTLFPLRLPANDMM